MTIWIDNDTLLRVNIHAPYKDFSRLDTNEIRVAANVVEIADPTPPTPTEGFTLDEEYFRTEQDDTPYIVWTRKAQEQLDDVTARKAKQAAKVEAKAENAESATVRYLNTHTAAEIANYVDTNVTNLATAKTVIARLAVAVGVILRED